MAKQQTEIEYKSRDELDRELNTAIGEILSAEEQSKRIIEQAETSVKGIQLDGAARERSLREENIRAISAHKEKAVADAISRADKQCELLIDQAHKNGQKLISDKRKIIEKRAAELFAQLGDM